MPKKSDTIIEISPSKKIIKYLMMTYEEKHREQYDTY
jgi:hypothetical protein